LGAGVAAGLLHPAVPAVLLVAITWKAWLTPAAAAALLPGVRLGVVAGGHAAVAGAVAAGAGMHAGRHAGASHGAGSGRARI
jgi:hypothetical protein